MSSSRQGSHDTTPGRVGSSRRPVLDRWFWLAGSLWLASLATAIWAAPVEPLIVAWLSFTTVGALVAWARPAHPVGWLLLADGMVWICGAATHRYVIDHESTGLSQAALAGSFDLVGWIVAIALIPLVLLLFPTGRFPGRWWRLVVALVVGGGALLAVSNAVQPGPLPSSPELTNPFGIQQLESIGRITAPVGEIFFFLGVVGGLLAVIVRFARSSGVERQQLRWLAFAACLMLLGFAVGSVLSSLGLPGEPLFNTVAMPAVPIAIGVALLRYRLWDLDLVIGKTIVYGLLALVVTLVYVLLVAGFGAMVGGGSGNDVWLAVLATAIAATLFQPVRTGTMTAVNRLLYRRQAGGEPPTLSIRTLGGFRVERDGEPVNSSQWRSKKARQLFKMLLARYDRPVHREHLIDALWPGETEGDLGNRLAVAASTIRAVLDPDKEHPSDRFLSGDAETLRLGTEHMWIDVVEFLRLVETGSSGDHLALEQAVDMYRGDFLEEDIYEDWAQHLRETARAAYVAALRKRAEVEGERGVDEGIAAQLKILDVDPWDEAAHLAIVWALRSSGRHGEAQRAYYRYEARMRELGITPSEV
ncbi:MAG TPA: BTAD domain-containing putative transcriptional regulator [Acidimicrobiia bacterium]|nr:BTAD domain-containing putative transcriptional regulator [Acidimicrobiia bacterium]